MAERTYRLTAAGREAWEGQDAAVPADYRRILWMMDVQGQGGVAEALSKLYAPEMLEEWLSEMEEIGLIESLPDGQGDTGTFATSSSDSTVALDQAQLREAAKIAGNTLARTGAYLSLDRLRRRPLPIKAPGDTVILIVEDDPDQLALADLRVSMAGYKVRVASSVNGFLQALVDEGAPDLLLLDVMLPDGDGFDVLGKMRRHQALGSLPIVMLTAKNDAADIGRGLVLGADGYITKPYTKNILADVIERVLKRVQTPGA
ncbi:MAG TPA: response regulator [Burkholderiales bacterium]|nr:response regulator [Burkholderiales bacterium]